MPLVLLLLAMLIAIPGARAMPVLSEAHPFAQRLSVATPQGEVARLIENCAITSSRTGGFMLPRRRGPMLYGLICEDAEGGVRLRVFAAADLSLLFEHAGGPGLTVRLLPQGLQLAEGADSLIWDAWDGDFGSPRFLDAHGEASGLRLEAGEALPPRLRPQNHVIARDPLEPLRLGPAADAPFFARASTHLLVHPRDEDAAFWRPAGFARVCIPDGGCGYVRDDRLAPAGVLHDNAEADALMRAAFGPPEAADGCWVRPGGEDGDLFCLRPQRLFAAVGPGRGTLVLVAAGMGFALDGPLSRCHACPAALALVVAGPDGVRATPLHPAGSWGRGPKAEDISLIGGAGRGWHVAVRDARNDRGTLVARHHLFGMLGAAPAWLGTLPGEVTRFVEAAPDVLAEEHGGHRLAWDRLPGGGVAPRLVPMDGPGLGQALRRDAVTDRYPDVELP